MRKVVYYHGGVVADFPVPDEIYDVFATRFMEMTAGAGEDLEKARRVLRRAMDRLPDDEVHAATGHNEVVAACYIWHYFNTTDEDTHIDGDILVADVEGDDQDIAYLPLADVELVQNQ